MTKKFKSENKAGFNAPAGAKCPWGMADIGLRCAWLAGHYDAHGKAAWDKAR